MKNCFEGLFATMTLLGIVALAFAINVFVIFVGVKLMFLVFNVTNISALGVSVVLAIIFSLLEIFSKLR